MKDDLALIPAMVTEDQARELGVVRKVTVGHGIFPLLYSEEDMAKFRGMSVDTLRRERGEVPYTGPPTFQDRRVWRYPLPAFFKWAEKKMVYPVASTTHNGRRSR